MSKSFCLRLKGIFECVNKKTLDADEVNALIELAKDEQRVDIRRICDFATAALDVLGIRKYEGNNADIFKIIHDFG